MRISILPAVMAAMLTAGGAQAATLIDTYEFTGDLKGAKGGVLQADSSNFQGTGPTAGLRVNIFQGINMAQGLGANYSIEMLFSLDILSSYRKIIDFKNLANDTGFYAVDHTLNLFPGAVGGTLKTGELAHLVFNRAASGQVTGFLNGKQVFALNDTGQLAVNSTLHFFRDDNATRGRESSSGFVDFIRVYDGPLSATEVAGLNQAAQARLNPQMPGVPEPASWAMMIMGFGAIGSALRRRRADVRVAFAI